MILGIIALVFLALKVSGLTNYRSSGYYAVTADFDNTGSLKVRAPVSIAGVHVGQVGAISLNPVTYRATVTLLLNDKTKIPTDSAASIYTQGLLGSNYISLSPGYADTNLKNGGQIQSTTSALILEKLIGQFIFSLKNNTSKGSGASS